ILLANISPDAFKMPAISIPLPVPIPSLISYNLFGLVVLAACGCGIFVARSPLLTLKRLGLEKPQPWHYGIAFLTLVGTFVYDYAWSFYTGSAQSGSIGSHLSQYNAGTFSAGGGAGGAATLAVF